MSIKELDRLLGNYILLLKSNNISQRINKIATEYNKERPQYLAGHKPQQQSILSADILGIENELDYMLKDVHNMEVVRKIILSELSTALPSSISQNLVITHNQTTTTTQTDKTKDNHTGRCINTKCAFHSVDDICFQYSDASKCNTKRIL